MSRSRCIFTFLASICVLLLACSGQEPVQPTPTPSLGATAAFEVPATEVAPASSPEQPTQPLATNQQPTLGALTPTPVPVLNPTPTLAPVREICPTNVTSHAELMNFDWESRPMRSGEAANIVYSPSDPDVLYLGIEVNTHSMYKSTDGGHTWTLLHTDDHAKDVAVHPTNPDIAFVTDSQKVWRTTSGGRIVYPIPEGTHPSGFERVLENSYPAGPSETSFSTIAIAPSNTDVVYTTIKGATRPGGRTGQLFRSTDGGASFMEVGGKVPTFNALLVHPQDDRRVFVGSADGVYISQDAGGSFIPLASWSNVVSLDSVDGHIIFAGGSRGILRSEDGGTSWTEQSQGLPETRVLRVRIARSSPNVVWATTANGVARSDDGGKTWRDASGASADSGLPSRNLQALAVHPENPDIALVSTETFIFSVRSDEISRFGQYYAQGIFRTEDGGKTWSRSDGGILEYNLEDITAHPMRPFEVWAGQQASRGFYRSRDAGQSWSISPSLLTHYPMRLVFFPDDPNKVASTSAHAQEDFGITYDSGINWETTSEQTFFDSVGRGINLFDPTKRQRANLHLHGLAINPANPQVIYVGSNDDPSEFNPKPLRGSHIFKSTDGGQTWMESDDGYAHDAETAIHEIKIDPQATNIIYMGTTAHGAITGNGIWKSTDAGGTWARSNSGMGDDTSVSVILIRPDQSGVLLAGTGEGIYRSIDAGGSWNNIIDGATLDMEYDSTDTNVVYAGKEDGVFLSKDFGLTWQDISANLPEGGISALAVNCNGTVVYAGVGSERTGEGLFASIAGSVSEVPADTTTGVDYGRSRRGPESGQSGESGGPSQEELQCLIEALGQDVVDELGPGGREPTSDEIEKLEPCFRR